MSAQPPPNLENLYKGSECLVCFQLFTEPKRLANCPHVLCCECIKGLIRNQQRKCPKCRTPITQTVAEVDSLEPAQAEAEILKFLINIKDCELCELGLSTTRCLECNYLICEKCKTIHSKLKPLHSVVSINFQTKEECNTHRNQPLEFFCLMCAEMFCLKCDRYSHAVCLRKYESMTNYMMRLVKESSDLIQRFTVSSESRKQLFFNIQCKFPKWRTNWLDNNENTPIELRVVQVYEFSLFCRQYLSTVKKEVEKDIEFYKELIATKESLCTTDAATIRMDQYLNKIIQIVCRGKKIVTRIEKAVGSLAYVKLARWALLYEKLCVQFLKYRKTYSFPIRHFGVKTETINQDTEIVIQNSECEMYDQQDGLNYLFVVREEFKAVELKDTDEQSISVEEAASVETDSLDIFHSIKCMRVDTRNGHLFTNRSVIRDNSLHNNSYVQIAEKRLVNSITAYTNTLEVGYSDCTNENECLKRRYYDNCTASIHVTLKNPNPTQTDEDSTAQTRVSLQDPVSLDEPDKYRYITHFSTLLLAIPFQHKDGKLCRTRTELNNPEIYCLIGSDKTNSHLEMVLLEFDAHNGFTYGLSVRSKLTRFKLGESHDLPRDLYFKFLRNTSYSFVYVDSRPHRTGVNRSRRTEFELLLFQSNICADKTWIPDVFLSVSEDGSTSQVPLSGLTVDLLCETKIGMVFVKYEADKQEINVGVLNMKRILKSTDLLYSVKSDDTKFPLCEIRPLTITDTTNGDLIVFCAVADMITTFLVILPFRKKTEILEIHCQVADMMTVYSKSTILDLEMDPEGNIMFILENRDGKKWRVITKYIIP